MMDALAARPRGYPMPHSMTGYARARAETEALSMVVSLRSVNHRFLDVQLRTPPDLEALEMLIRRTVKGALKRGQVQVSVSLRWSETPESLTVREELVDGYFQAFRTLAPRYGVGGAADLNAALRIPGVFSFEAADDADERTKELEPPLRKALAEALDALRDSRATEGAGIVEDLRQRRANILAQVNKLAAARPDALPKFQERLQKRITDLLGDAAPDPQRILQEAAVLTDRADISEEMQRLQGHLDRLGTLLESDGELGKNLDFLAQEMNREANTVLSKSTPLGAAGAVVTDVGLALKAEIEKIREQAQNLE